MYALCVSGAVNTQGFVWKFFTCYKYNIISNQHTREVISTRKINTSTPRKT